MILEIDQSIIVIIAIFSLAMLQINHIILMATISIRFIVNLIVHAMLIIQTRLSPSSNKY